MANYAAMAMIITGPVPGDSGTTITLEQDTGVRFPLPPFPRFTALVFHTNTVGPLVRGENCEEVEVLDIVGDVVTIERGDESINIVAGMNLALLRTKPCYKLGETVTLAWDFGSPDTPYQVAVLSPNGELGGFGSATGVEDLGGGSTSFSFTPDRGGTWHYRFESDSMLGDDAEFYVDYSSTLVI